MRVSTRPALALFAVLLIGSTGCRRWRFPEQPADYREYAYVTNAGAGTVSVLDLVELRQQSVLRVGNSPSAIAANPVRNELYTVNTGSDSMSVIDAETNKVAATIPLRRRPVSIDVDRQGSFAYVAGAGSNSVSVIDLQRRREIGSAPTGTQPAQARLSPDGHTLVVSNAGAGSVSIFSVAGDHHLTPRATFPGCSQAGDLVILPDSRKTFVACSGDDTVMAISLAAPPDSWPAKQDTSALNDHLLARLRVGKTPMHLALKPDGGEIFVSNFGGNSISEIATGTNEVGGSYPIGDGPVRGLVSGDNSTLWVANSGADSISLYSIDDGRLTTSIRTGPQPGALAFSTDEHLLLAADAKSGDVAVIRTRDRNGPTLFTMLPSGARPAAIAIKAFHQR